MSQIRNPSYAMAGSQNAPSMRMHVSSHVYVKDGDAGCEEARENYRSNSKEVKKNARANSVSFKTASLLLALAFMVLSVMVLLNAAKKSALSKQIAQMNTAIEQTVKDNYDLNMKVVSARDSARISYKAVQELGMISAEGAETYYVTAPETRPAEYHTLSGDSLSGTYAASLGNH